MTRPERACPERRVVLPNCSARTARLQPRTAAPACGRCSARLVSAARRDCPPGAPRAATRVARLRRVDACAACRAPPRRHHHHVHAPRRAFAARARGVGRARRRRWCLGSKLASHRPPPAAAHDAGFLRPPLWTAPLAPARLAATPITAPARRGGATKAGCHVIASAGRRTTCRVALPLAQGSSVRAQRVRASRAQRIALAWRVTALQLRGNVERTLRARMTIAARSAAFIARPWCPSATVQRAARWACIDARATAAAASSLPVAAMPRRAPHTVASRAPPSAR